MRWSSVLRAVRMKGGGTLQLDLARLTVRGGTGGRGLPLVGGIGGNGGDVWLEASPRASLQRLINSNQSLKFSAQTGSDASCRFGKLRIVGRAGKDKVLQVPVGITVTKADSRWVIGELNTAGDRLLVSAGGAGGSAASGYQPGKGVERDIQLDLKLVADLSLVGFTNAGKSTLLKAVSRTAPMIASYPFTTLRPQLGMMCFDDHRQVSMADLPGLIEGSYRNAGMGHSFLKHIERTAVIVMMVDVSGFQLNDLSPYRTALETICLLHREIELYNADLLDKPAVLCLNKMDLLNADKHADHIEATLQRPVDEVRDHLPVDLCPAAFMPFRDVFRISAMLSHGTEDMRQRLRQVVDEVDDERRAPPPDLQQSSSPAVALI